MAPPSELLTTEALRLEPTCERDSRGRPTVGVWARLGGLSAFGDCPAGASKGSDEARTVSVADAQRNVAEVLLPLAQKVGADVRSPQAVRALDAQLAAHAGRNFDVLGANATLPVSRALWRLGAAAAGVPLWRFLRAALGEKERGAAAGARPVHFLFNVFNGGLHALQSARGEVLGRERIDVQEIMVVPTNAPNYAEALRQGEAIDQALKHILLTRYGAEALTRADEAGFSVRGLGDSVQAAAHVMEAVVGAGLRPGHDVKLALDVAASSFYDAAQGTYRVAQQVLDRAGMVQWLLALVDRYPGQVLSVEDGLDENDWQGWAILTAALRTRGIASVGDDLFVTQLPRLRRGIAERSASAVLIKVNQNGTVGGTLDVIEAAHAAGMHCIVSHRSGETLDDSIADLAVGCGAFGLKSGDPQPPVDFADEADWVRRRKYLRVCATQGEADAG